jgi:CheY-specific phosphatase CheX
MTTVSYSTDTFRAGVEEITRSVFETMLGCTAEALPEESAFQGELTGAVYYAGQWSGALLLECSVAQAIDWAARIVGDGASDILDDDAKDALGELTNILAGNLKPVLPGGVSLTAPSVVDASGASLYICHGNAVERMLFSCPTGPFRVTLVRVVTA